MELFYNDIWKIAAPLMLIVAVAGCGGGEITPEVPVEVAAPVSVVLTDAGETSLTFSWRPVEGAEYYTARLEEGDGTFVRQNQTQTNTYTFTGLVTGKEYQFKVRVRTADGDSGYSEPLKATPGVSVPGEDPGTDEPSEPLEGYEKFLIPSDEEDGVARAFPGAEGGGMYTTGGRGGRVIHVTNLNDSGEGSLRAAVEASGARTVVFDVAGIIRLQSELRIRNGNITIAGQTAPGDGICIAGQTVRVDADNVIIRFMRFRLGYDGNTDADGEDAIWGRYHNDIILDHCSMSWSVDEVGSFYANRNFTMQWCILSEALCNSGHSKGGHGYGGIWGGRDASFHHNLLAHNDSRNARIDHPGIYINNGIDYRSTHRGNVDYRNNVIYNYGSNSTYGGEDGHFNIVGNYYKPGPASDTGRRYFVDAYWYNSSSKIGSAYPELYLDGNYHTAGIDENRYPGGIYYHDQSSSAASNPEGVVLSAPLPIVAEEGTVYVSTHSAQSAYTSVTGRAGASLVRDAVDIRVTGNVLAGDYTYEGSNGSTGGIIDSQEDVGGWPEYAATSEELASVTDTDGDGMPDWFEEEFGLDNSAQDGTAKNLDPHGRYTNFEMYLHYLVKDIVAAQNSAAVYTALE